eukprot:1794696-Karenia_brevis.AAC.1
MRKAFMHATASWLSVFESEQWTVMGPKEGISRDWAIKFVGSGVSGSNARRAKKAMQVLRKDDGE